jgi:uncharacterized protein YcnI
MTNTLRRAATAISTGLGAAAAATAMILAGAAAASAHVSVSPDDTGANGYTHLTFNLPNESATAKTNKLEVTLPTDTPFTSVSVKPVEGWTAQVITTDLPKPVTVAGATVTKAPTSVVWTANDAAHEIGQNQYQSFSLSVGRLPAEGTTVTLPATQTYTDGSVVAWDQKPVDGQAEPEHPAPSFTTTAADDAAHGSHSATATPDAQAAVQASAQGSDASGPWGIALGALGVVLGAAALAVALGTRRKASK